MAEFSIFRHTFSFTLPIFFALSLISKPISSLSLQTLTNNPNFDSETALFGDAEVVNSSSYVKLTRPSISSSGLLMQTKPFKFLEGNLANPTSFSTEFSFSISPGNGDGIVLAFVPSRFRSKLLTGELSTLSKENRFLGIEFDTKMDDNVGDLNANHVGINVDSFVSVTVCDVSPLNLVLNNGEKLKSWINYDASSKRLEVRLGKFGDSRPYNPIIAYEIDLAEMWRDEDVIVGITSWNGDSMQSSSVYSWRFRVRKVLNSMHSLPVDPQGRGYLKESKEGVKDERKSVCPLTVIGGLIFATVCGALVAFIALFIWAIVANRRAVFPTECHVYPVDFRYEKVDVVVEKIGDDLKN